MNRTVLQVRPMQIVLVAVSLALALNVGVQTSLATDSKSRIISPQAPRHETYGKTYGEWSAAWWAYALSLPNETNPLTDETGERCGQGQTGPVFFLVGVINVSGKATRPLCTVPSGKALFFPIINNECSDLEPAPFFALGRGALAACNRHFVDTATGLTAEIDGVPVENLQRFRVCEHHDDDCDTVPIVHVELPVNNVLGVPPGRVTSLGDGYYLLLSPMSPGRHEIHFSGTIRPREFTFSLDIKYAPLMVR